VNDFGSAGLWICCDGVEGAGKTTLATALARRLTATIAPEFSMSPTGQALRAAVQTSPHYIATSTWGQSLAFIGDFHETFESTVMPALAKGAIVISDRGWLSKYAYQAQVLSNTFARSETDRRLFQLLDMPRMPDITFYLDAETDVLAARLQERDGSCTPDRIEFIKGARDCYERFVRRTGETGFPSLRVVQLGSLSREATLSGALSTLEGMGVTAR